MGKSSVRLMFTFCLCLISLSIKAQILEDAQGRPILEQQFTDIQGSPYFVDSWTKGSVKLVNGKIFTGIDLKYDQMKEELLFKSKGQTLSFVDPVNEFDIVIVKNGEPEKLVFRNGYKSAEGGAEKTFYQILSDGETPLIKRVLKKVIQNKPYNSATTIKTFQEIQTYFLVKNGLMVKIRKDKKSVFTVLDSYITQLETFIKTNNLNLKDDADLARLIDYYNSLK